MESPILFSIIIPTFNAEKYIERCITTLVQQDIPHQHYEIIVVNDGSTDHTLPIVQSLSLTYPVVKCFTTTNQGVSAARNKGLEEARGEIILFVDADDFIEPNSLSHIYTLFNQNKLDILVLDYNYWDNNGNKIVGFDHKELRKCPQHVMPGKDFIRQGYFPSTVWLMAYRRSYIEEHLFRFMLNVRHEDEEFIPKILYFAQRIQYQPLICYNYTQSETSFMQNYKEAGLFDRLKVMDSINRFKEKEITEKDIQRCVEEHLAIKLMEILHISFAIHSTAQKELIATMKKTNLSPLKQNKKGGFHSLLYALFPHLFIAYYQNKYNRKHRRHAK